MVFYNEGYYRGLDFAWEFIDRNIATFESYVSERFSQYDKTYCDYLARQKPLDVYYALNDYMDDSVTKLQKSMDLYLGDGQVQLVFGGRGSGKTASILYFIEQLYLKQYYKENEIFWVGLPNNKLPEWITYSPSIEDCPEDSVIIQDETGVQFSSRNFTQKNNKDLGQLLMVARHQHKNIIFITQYTASVDIEVVRQASFSLIKKNAVFQATTEREGIFKSIVEFMMPQNKEDCLIVSDNELMTIQVPLPSFWSDDISRFYRKIKNEDEAIAIGYNYYKAGARISFIMDYLLKSSYEFDEKQLLEKFKEMENRDK